MIQKKLTDFKIVSQHKFSKKATLPDKQVDIDQNNTLEIAKLKGIIKDLTTNKNISLLAKSELKKTGFTIKHFYDNFIYISNGHKPDIAWSKDENLNKIQYHKILHRLERERRITNMFYYSVEWIGRSAEVLERDKHICGGCGKMTNRVHHRGSATYNPEMCLDPRNLITMCKKCEDEIHNRNRTTSRHHR